MNAQTITIVSGGEADVAEDDLLGGDARGERRDRLEAQRLLDGGLGELRVLDEQLPLLGVFGEQPHGVRELALGRVDAAGEDVEDEVDALDVGQPLAGLFRPRSASRCRSSRGSWRRAAEQRFGVLVELLDGLLDVARARWPC